MSVGNPMVVLGFAAAFAAGTVAGGWWAVPVIGLVWGFFAHARRPGLRAAAAAGLAWAVLLAWTATQGPVGQVARRIGGVFLLPGPALMALAVVFAMALAGTAAVVGRAAGPRRAPGAP